MTDQSTPSTIELDGLRFDRDTVANLADRIRDMIEDQFSDAFHQLTSTALGRDFNEDAEDGEDLEYRTAFYTAMSAVIANLNT